jgi:hypothetical protein
MEIFTLFVVIIIAYFGQSLLFQSMVFKNLEYSCEFSTKSAIEGDTIFLVETVQNRKFLPVPWLKADIHSSRWLDFAETSSVVNQDSRRVTSCFFLKSFQKTTRRWKVKCSKRGAFFIDNVTLVGGDLFQYGRESVPVHIGAELMVYPDVIDIEELFAPAKFLQGDNIVKRWIIDDPFIISGTREYTPCDSMNKIHWQATAKAGKLMVKKNDFTSQLSVTVILNTQSIEHEYGMAVFTEKIELGIKVAATIFDSSLKLGMPARFATNGTVLENGREAILTSEASGYDHYVELLKILAKLKLKNVIDFGLFLKENCSNYENTDIFIITAVLDDNILEFIHKSKMLGNKIKIIFLNDFSRAVEEKANTDIYYLSRVDEKHG